jgi:hypothetical protein
MKKYADNLLRSLEGITSRLSQLEIYCYKLERSIGELRSDVIRDDSDQRLKSLEKHLHEVSKLLFRASFRVCTNLPHYPYPVCFCILNLL